MPKRLAKTRSKEQIAGARIFTPVLCRAGSCGYDPLPIGIGSGSGWPLGGPSVALGWPKRDARPGGGQKHPVIR